MNITRNMIIDSLRQNYSYLHEKYHVKKIGLFGSFASETANETSDVDLVIEFEQPIGLQFIELCEYLEISLGRKVDVLTTVGLANIHNSAVANRINNSLIYVQP